MMKSRLALLAAAVLIAPNMAAAAPKAAIFPFDMRDAGQAGELIPQYDPEDLRRLTVVADELKRLMSSDGKYEIVDLTPLAAEVEAASPFSKCDGCEAPIAQKAGADIAVTGFVDKVTDALISLQIFARDAATGKLTKSMSAEIRGNTDDLWLHGVRWLWKNRFNAEATQK